MKRVIASALAAAMAIMYVPIVNADNRTTAENDKKYLCVDLTTYANSISFDSEFAGKDKYTIPNYMGLGRDSDTQDLKHIYNKNAFDNKKDANGLLHDTSGRPFNAATSTTDKNTILLGKGQYINKTSVTIDIPEGKYYSFSFLSDNLYDVDASYFEMSVNYTDGTSTKDPNWIIGMRNVSEDALMSYNGVDSYIDFTYSADNAINTGLLFRLEDADPTKPQSVNWKLPVYTLKTDETKTVNNITFTQNSDWRALNIFALTGEMVSKTDEIENAIDRLPNETEINADNFVDFRNLISLIESMLDESIALDSARLSKYNAVKAVYERLLNENGLVKRIHVSPAGSASNSGTLESPLDSLESARKAVAVYKANNPDITIDVIFHEGTYRFSSGVYFTSSDSGTSESPITYKAAPGEKVCFKGSREIELSGARLIEEPATLAKLPASARGKAVYIDLAAQGITDIGQIPIKTDMWNDSYAYEGSEIFFNNKQQTLSRWPNGDNEYAQFASVSSAGETGADGAGGSIIAADYREARWTNAADAWMVGFLNYDWHYDRVKIAGIAPASKEITLANGTTYGIGGVYSRRWAVINLLEELDRPGEWYIDNSANILYYYPEANMENDVMEITTLRDNLINMNDVSNVNFSGITFSQTRGCAIKLTNKMENMTISDCRFENIGRYGIWQITSELSGFLSGTSQSYQFRERGNENFHLTNDAFYNCGKMAFDIYCGSRSANKPSGCSITNNYIYNTGTTDKKSYGASVQGVGIEIANNTIHHSGYGLSFVGSDILIHHNEIYNVMSHMNDGSAIYTGRNFINRGNKIYQNYIHDARTKDSLINTSGDKAMSYGIYLDDMDSGTEIYQNIIVGTDSAVMINSGMSNNIHDNTVIDTTNGVAAIGINPMRNEANAEAMITQANAALPLEGYARFKNEIEADLNSGFMVKPARNTISNNIAYESKVDFDSMMAESGLTATFYKHDIQYNWGNVINNNRLVSAEDFVNSAAGDYRLKNSSSYAASTCALDESFDMSSIGVQTADFNENPILCEQFNLSYPLNGMTELDSAAVTFAWERPIGADRFRLVVASDSAFGNIAYDITTYETTHTIYGLTNGQTYYWKVYAKNESLHDYPQWENSGGVLTFKTANTSNTASIMDTVAAAQAMLRTMTEGYAGKYKSGTKQVLSDKIAFGTAMAGYSGYTDEDRRTTVEDINDIMTNSIFVNSDRAKALDLSSTENTFLKPGETSQLMINGAQVPASGVSYTVDNKDVVTVSDSGLVTASGTGVATVTAQSGDIAASIMFVVTDADVHENGYEAEGQSTEYARTGQYSHSLSANETILNNLDTKIKDNGVIQLWFYDDMKGYRPSNNYSPEDIFQLYGYNGGINTINMWIYFNESLYRVQDAGNTATTSNNITRTAGWHQLLIYSSANDVYIYIDGSLLASTPRAGGGLSELNWYEGSHLDMWIDDVTYADVMVNVPTSIDLSRTVNTFLKPGGYSQILVNGTANVPGVSYASSNEAVAAVDEAGMVTGISEGTAVITASAGSVTKKIMFAVTNNQINSKNYETDGNNTVHARTGEKSLYIAMDAAGKKDFAYPSISNGVVQLWFYDELNGGREADNTYDTYFNLYRWASGDPTNFATCLAFNYDNRYGYQGTLDSSVTNYNNYRSKGWHQYMAYRYDTYVDIYVDGELMCRYNGIAKDAATTAIQWVGGDVNMWVDDIAFTSFTAGGCITASTYKESDAEYKLSIVFKKSLSDEKVYAAAYAADGKLLSVKSTVGSVSDTVISIPKIETEDIDCMKVFCWKDDMMPLGEAEIINIQ